MAENGVTTNSAVDPGPIDALRAFNNAFIDHDSTAFLKLADAEDDEAKAIADEMAKEFTAERELKTLLLKKFNPDDVRARVSRLYGMLLPPDILKHPPVEIQGDDAAIVLNTETNYSIGLVRKDGIWKVKYLEEKMSLGPSHTKKFKEAITLITAQVNTIRKEVEDGTLTSLDTVETRLDAAFDPSSTQPVPPLP